MTTQFVPAVRAVTPEEVVAYRRDGWVKLEGLLPVELVQELLAVAHREMGSDADNPAYNGRGSRYAAWTQASERSQWLRAVSHSAELGRTVSALAGGRSLRWYADTYMAKKGTASGGDRTPWHQDLPQHAFDRGGAMTMWIPLVDCPPERGSLTFLTGSHRAGPLGRFGRRADGADRALDIVDTYPSVVEEHPVSPPLHLHVGDVTVHDALTVHAAPENTTNVTRWVYSVTWFPSETLYTGASSYHTNGMGLTIDEPFDDERFPVVV
jgi:ectoine hydroxylase-related dioxygenase (phytanoyl-CoA dioxygenase family)